MNGVKCLSEGQAQGSTRVHHSLHHYFVTLSLSFPTPLGCCEDRRGERRRGGHCTDLDWLELEWEQDMLALLPAGWGPWGNRHPSGPGLVS